MIKYLIVLVSIAFSGGLFAQIKGDNIIGGDNSFLEPKKYTIASTTVTGVDYMDADAIRLVSGLTVGKEITIPGQDISKAIQTLWEQEYFSDVQILADKVIGDDIFLVIALKGRPKLEGYKFEGGIRKGEEDNLREIIDLVPNITIITESLVQNTKNIIKGYYNEKGFYRAKVDIIQVQDTSNFNSRNFHIIVDKK